MDEETFQRLCQAQIEGTAGEHERAQLAQILHESEVARRDYILQMKIHAMLSWQHGRAQSATSPPTAAAPVRVRWKHPRWTTLAAAAVILISGTLVMLREQGGAEFDVLAAQGVNYKTGDHLKQRTVQITRGTLSLKLASGAVVDLQGPATLELLSSMHVRLLDGSLTAHVGTQAKGFIVDTADAHVVDLGTRFGVSASPSQSTDVAVFEGTVEVYEPALKHKVPEVTLNAGDAVRIGRARKPVRLKMIALSADARSLDAPRGSDVVTAASDNVTDTAFRGYYGLVRGGMGEGAGVYTTGHTRTWHALKGQPFPKELEGADLIRTFSVDRDEADLRITLQIAQPCDLYVMLHVRAPAPDWVLKDYQDTGHRLRSGPWIPRGTRPEEEARFYQDDRAYHTFAVWRRRISEPGPVTLGSPMNAAEPNNNPFMYGLAVRKLP